MGIFSKLRSLVFDRSDISSESQDIAAPDTRAYKGAEVKLQNHNWAGTAASADAEAAYAMPVMRNRARELVQNNPYAERYLAELEANVLGPTGMTLQMQVEEYDPQGNEGKGAMVKDEVANDKIENAWLDWKQKGNCDVTGELSFHDIERMMLRAVATDGNALCRIMRGWKDNEFRFALQPIEADALDTSYNATLPNGNIVVMGVEMDRWRRRVACHILTYHPGDFLTTRITSDQYRERVDARDIIHMFMRKRIGQTVGVTWFAPVMDLMEMLRGYEEAELISARSEACKGGFFYNDLTGEAGMMGPPSKPDGIRKKMVPGQMDILPYGWKYQPNNPTHPNGNYSNYRAGVLRGISSGLSCSYNILANDLTGVSYSSLRGGLLDEREIYKMIQQWFISHFEIPVFNAWLSSVLLTNKLNLPSYREDKFRKPYFQGRSWAWVDPRKDIEAAALEVQHGFKSRRQIIAENGGYILDVAKEQAADKKLERQYGLNWDAQKPTAGAPPKEQEDPEESEESEDPEDTEEEEPTNPETEE